MTSACRNITHARCSAPQTAARGDERAPRGAGLARPRVVTRPPGTRATRRGRAEPDYARRGWREQAAVNIFRPTRLAGVLEPGVVIESPPRWCSRPVALQGEECLGKLVMPPRRSAPACARNRLRAGSKPRTYEAGVVSSVQAPHPRAKRGTAADDHHACARGAEESSAAASDMRTAPSARRSYAASADAVMS